MSVEKNMRTALGKHFPDMQLVIANNSAAHSGHAGDDGSGESHFRLEIKSSKFSGMSRIECHRMVFDALKSEMKMLPHALEIKAKPLD